jgi:ParB-like nuclease domain
MLLTGFAQIDAQRAFDRQARSRRRAAVARRLRRGQAACGRLPLVEVRGTTAGPVAGGIREIPLQAIRGTLEPSRSAQFDDAFRPAPKARARWERVWLAEHRGRTLPPIAVVPVGDGGYAIRDGHHRVSVARARGAETIDAVVDAA